jgi:predicted nucleic acid-binding protein
VALAWCFDDEATPAALDVLQSLDAAPAAAPTLMPLELANVLALAERRRRITPARVTEFVALVGGLPIVIDDQGTARALREVLELARAERLTAYDATYLELAMRLGIALATKDTKLRRAAAELGVPLLGA